MQNRKRNMEQISSLKSQIVQKKSKLKIMLLLLVQYMFTHKVNVWDGEVAEYMELLRNCIPVLLKTTVDMGESARYLATNQILFEVVAFAFRRSGRYGKKNKIDRRKQRERIETGF